MSKIVYKHKVTASKQRLHGWKSQTYFLWEKILNMRKRLSFLFRLDRRIDYHTENQDQQQNPGDNPKTHTPFVLAHLSFHFRGSFLKFETLQLEILTFFFQLFKVSTSFDCKVQIIVHYFPQCIDFLLGDVQF